MLNTITMGEAGAHPPLLIAHGLYGSARNWRVLQKRLAERRQVIAVDMRNHGDSFHAAAHGYADLADDLAVVIAAHGGQADVLGHSMGGKAAMMLALTRPDLVNRLIVADIAPVAYGHSQLPNIDAMKAVDLSGVTRRAEADSQLKAWVAEAPLRAFFLQSLDLGPDGARWKLNLDVLADQMPQLMGFPDISATFSHPALFLHGALSDYVQPGSRAKINQLFPNAMFEEIDGAGHWLHAEKPREFQSSVQNFLS